MKRLLVSVPVLAALALPAAAQADPSNTDKTNAAKECRTERGTTPATREAFKAKYGTNANKSNAFGKCVSKRSKSEESQRKSAASNAAKDCKAERAADAEAFKTKYGTNKNKNNAYGKCVSQKAKAKKDAADAADAKAIAARKSAAKTCATERKADADAFKAKYGTNKNKSNAFGKCVSADGQEEADPVLGATPLRAGRIRHRS